MTLKEAAAHLGYRDASALRQAIRRKQLNAELVGTTYIVTPAALEAYTQGKAEGRGRRPRKQSPEPEQET